MKENKIQFSINQLYNFGYIKSKLPKKLYDSLLKECLQASKNEKLISDLSNKGVPEHYYVEKNHDSLISFIKQMHEAYERSFPGLWNIKVLTDNLPFSYDRPWINLQKQNEFVPIHLHDGIFSYSIWMKIPYDSSKEAYTGNFEFVYCDVTGASKSETIKLSKKDEGTIIMFPAKLQHIVWPFYKNKDARISINGNISFNSKKEK
jgi:hypothetical protein